MNYEKNQLIRKKHLRLLLFFASIILTFWPVSAGWSQKESTTATPIRIEADRMETSQAESAVLFSGNVQASQGDLIIKADTMMVLYIRDNAKPDAVAGTTVDLNQKIDKITAEGNVKIVQEDWVATGDTMNFNADDRIVILAGNAKAWQKQNMVSGEKIVLYLDEGKSIVERSSREGERVKAFIYPSSRENKATGDQ